jgi:hypothetical protein
MLPSQHSVGGPLPTLQPQRQQSFINKPTPGVCHPQERAPYGSILDIDSLSVGLGVKLQLHCMRNPA